MPKVDKEQARSLEQRKSRSQIFKNWILHHKIETTAILTCIIGVIVILCLVFVGGDSGQAAPANNGTPNSDVNGDSDDSSSSNNPPLLHLHLMQTLFWILPFSKNSLS